MTLPVQHFRCVGGTEEGAAGDHSSHGGKQDPGRGHQALEVRRGADGVRSVCAATNDPVSAEWPGPNGAGVSLGSGGAGPGRGRVGARAWRRGRSGLQLLDPLPAAAFSPGSRGRVGARRLLFLLHLPRKTALASLCQRSLETTQSPTTKDPTLLLGPQGPGDRQRPVHILRKALAWVRCPDP